MNTEGSATVVMPRLRAPIVLVHGICGFSQLRLGRFVLLSYFRGIPGALKTAGNRVVIPWTSYAGPVALRAAQLRAFLDRELPGEAFHLIGHSMGGLDARYMISRLGMARRVLSLTTLGTPHRGTPLADWGQRRLRRWVLPVFDFLGLSVEGFQDLTTESCRQFNATVPNAVGVRYFSVAGDFHVGQVAPRWSPTSLLIERSEGTNDGLVSVRSAQWGEDCQVWEGHHFSLANWGNRVPGSGHHFPDRVPLYAGLLGRLADLGM
jgi:triacylglycerol lipase